MAIYNGGLNIIAPDISGKEDKSNKVTSWSATTTDTHYPSEKLVKGALDTKVNTANVLTLEEIRATTDLTGKVASASALLSSGEIKLLGTLTTHGTSYTLAENLNNFRLAIGILIYNQYSLATTIAIPSILIGGEMIICFYDGTLRKGQFQVDPDGINIFTNVNPNNWTGISKILLYGVR